MSEEKEPLSHIERDPLPWRALGDNTTECGRDVNDVAKFVTLDAAIQLVKKHGRTRAAFLLCQTCCDRATGYHMGGGRGQTTWADYTLDRLNHESGRRREQIEKELRAMAELVAAHREEFAALLDGTIVPIGELQRQKLQKERSAGRSRTPRRPAS